MNLYGGPIDRYFENEEKRRRHTELKPALSRITKYNIRKPDLGDCTLSEDQILQLKDKYKLPFVSCEEESELLQDLKDMGVLTKEDCGCYHNTGGNIFDSLNRQVTADINRLYQMAIAGRYCDRHIENIRSQQKILEVLEQLMTE